MHLPPAHAEHSIPILHSFIRQHPLGIFTTALPNPSFSTLQTSHVPFILDVDEEDPDDRGRLRAHMARANPQAKAIVDALASKTSGPGGDEDGGVLEEDVLIVFSAPVHSYVTPKFYTSTKPSTGKVVPTWDYAAVQAYGKARIYHAPSTETGEFLAKALGDLSQQEERTMLERMGNEDGKPWDLSEAPEKYVEILKKAIIGIEITLTKLEGRFKLSQEKAGGDWQGVVEGFRAMGTGEGDVMADMIKERGPV